MSDFRIDKIKSAIAVLGWEISAYDENYNYLSLKNGFIFSFSDKTAIHINVICLELALISNMLTPLINKLNETSNYAKYGINQEEYLVALSTIENTVFMRDDYLHELVSILEILKKETFSVSKIFLDIRIRMTGA